MNRLSVIIPYHSTPAELESSILSLLENRPENCEICVVLNHPYENIYELGEDEVHFLGAETQTPEEKCSVADSLLLGVTACDSSYVYMMPAGTQFNSGWLAALEIMDQSEDLGAFFLDENLALGGFFRKPLLETFLQNSVNSGLYAESDTECLTNLVSLMQEAALPCGLAEIEFVEDSEFESDSEIGPEIKAEIGSESEIEPEIKTEIESESEIEPEFALEIEAKPQNEAELKEEAPFPSESESESSPKIVSEPENKIEPFSIHEPSTETGLLTRFCAWFRGILNK